jgi:hypothetical protein
MRPRLIIAIVASLGLVLALGVYGGLGRLSRAKSPASATTGGVERTLVGRETRSGVDRPPKPPLSSQPTPSATPHPTIAVRACSGAPGAVLVTGDNLMPEQPIRDLTPSPTGQVLHDALVKVITNDDNQAAEAILNAWADTYPPLTTSEKDCLDPARGAAYEVFETVRNAPLEQLVSFSPSRLPEGAIQSQPYVVAPSRLVVLCYDYPTERAPGDPWAIPPAAHFVIEPFRPTIAAPGGRLLNLTPEYAEAFDLLLNRDFWVLPGFDYAAGKRERERRLTFLAPYVPVNARHHLVSYPEIYAIKLSETLDRAVVTYGFSSEGTEAILTRQPDRTWRIQISDSHWIE